ncbi:MAG: nitroreductase family protein [Myxococcales bacterium]|nr:nitroreductase family protein [Myxococcales bacterium]
MERRNLTEPEWDAATGDVALLRLLVRAAILAPSGHNTQPWRFRIAEETLELLADRSRALPVVDPDNRELTISCGAALAHVTLAALRFGRRPEVTRIAEDGDLLARIRLGDPCEVDEDARRLFDAMTERHTDRGAFRREAVDAGLLEALRTRAAKEGVWLDVVTDDARKAALADAVAEADLRQYADRRFRRELADWMRPNTTVRRDGIPAFALGIDKDLVSEAVPTAVRWLDLGRSRAREDRAAAEAAPALLVLGTEDDTVEAWLRAGEALATAWLEATARGWAFSFFNQPVEDPALRPEIDRVLEHRGFPQLVVRLGRPEGPRDARRTPRRYVDEVVEAVRA